MLDALLWTFTYGLLEDRHVGDVTMNFSLLYSNIYDRLRSRCIFNKKLHVAMHLYIKRAQKASKCGKNISYTAFQTKRGSRGGVKNERGLGWVA